MENKTVDNIGNLVISEDVIASIALNAAKDVEGVSSFAARTPDVHSIFKLGEVRRSPCASCRRITMSRYISMSISRPEQSSEGRGGYSEECQERRPEHDRKK